MLSPDRITEIRHIAPTAGPEGLKAINDLLAEVERLRGELANAKRNAARAAMHDLQGFCPEHWEVPDDPAGLWMIIVHGGDTGVDADWDEAYAEARAVR